MTASGDDGAAGGGGGATSGWWLVVSGRNFGAAGGDFRIWIGGLELPGVAVVREHTRLQVRLPARLPGMASGGLPLGRSFGSDRSYDGKGPLVPAIPVADVVVRVNGVVCTLESSGMVEPVEALSNDDDDAVDEPVP